MMQADCMCNGLLVQPRPARTIFNQKMAVGAKDAAQCSMVSSAIECLRVVCNLMCMTSTDKSISDLILFLFQWKYNSVILLIVLPNMDS